jgi:BirA family biotin operon repressor/biotin-[acetyl-CoA-carboxylase] ligase
MFDSMSNTLLLQLREVSPEWVSSEVLREPSGVSRAAISKQIKRLVAMGYDIESSPRKGYRLVAERDSLDGEIMIPRLAGTRFGAAGYTYKQVTDSTNDDVRTLAREGAAEGVMVVAEIQEAGRGRLGRKWFGRAGDCLQMSLLLRPPLVPQEAGLIPLLAAAAVYRGLTGLGLEGVGIKWPNDVLVDGMKICGILCEMSVDMDGIEFALLGMGMNINTPAHVFPDELKGQACSMASVSGTVWNRSQVMEAVLREVESLVSQVWSGNRQGVLDMWREGAVTLGRRITVTQGNGATLEGIAENITDNGALMLRDGDGKSHVLYSGEVSLGTIS